MSAANASAPSPSLEEEMRAHEPSMEEILASIRRIIADDDSLPGARRERDDRRRGREVEEPAPAVETAPASSAQTAYASPALERREEPAMEAAMEDVGRAPLAAAEEEPVSVAEIRHLRLDRAAPEPVTATYDTEGDDAFYAAAPDATRYEGGAGPAAVATDAPLMSSDAASSIASHFQALAASMVINDSGLLHKYAQEMLRPMLKQWLDDNLPVIVERLVRAEIERVARSGRR